MFNQSYSIYECNSDCPDRKVGCRTDCEKWARDEAKREKVRKAIEEDRVANHYSVEVSVRRRSKELRKKNKRKYGVYHM